MGSTKIKTTTPTDSKTEAEVAAEVAAESKEAAKPKVKAHARSKKYTKLRSQVDKTIAYSADQAIELVKRLSNPKLPTITADVNYRDESYSGEIKFPHSTGKSVRIAIADDALLADVAAGKIEFDVLLAVPAMMPKLAKLARVLGPKGLMPNPKNKTVIADPVARQKELEGGKVSIKTEKKAPLLHIQIGKVTQDTNELIDNLKALVKTVNSIKIAKLTISSTMSPGVKVDINTLISET